MVVTVVKFFKIHKELQILRSLTSILILINIYKFKDTSRCETNLRLSKMQLTHKIFLLNESHNLTLSEVVTLLV